MMTNDYDEILSGTDPNNPGTGPGDGNIPFIPLQGNVNLLDLLLSPIGIGLIAGIAAAAVAITLLIRNNRNLNDLLQKMEKEISSKKTSGQVEKKGNP